MKNLKESNGADRKKTLSMWDLIQQRRWMKKNMKALMNKALLLKQIYYDNNKSCVKIVYIKILGKKEDPFLTLSCMDMFEGTKYLVKAQHNMLLLQATH